MNWIAQVRHVAAKDTRYARWLLIAYIAMPCVAAVTMVTGRALGPYWTSQSAEVLGMRDAFVLYLPAVTIILGLILTVSLLQADSPTRANAFWASRPLSPSAVFTAKVTLVAVAIVALPHVAALVALRALDISGADAAVLLARAAVSYAEMALAVMVIGALTDDLRAFVATFVGVIAGVIVVEGAFGDWVPSTTGIGAVILMAVSMVAGVLVMISLYRTHDRRAHVWVVAVTAALALVVASFSTPTVQSSAESHLSSGPPVEFDPAGVAVSGQIRQMSMRMRVTQAPDSERLDFQPDAVALRLVDGKTVHADHVYPASVVRGTLPPVGHPVTWIIDQTNNEWPSAMTIEPNDFDRAAVSRGVRGVSVGGIMTASRAHVVASLPFTLGSSTIHDGRRVAIYGLSHDLTGAEVWLQMSTVSREGVTPEPNRGLSDKGNLQFAIVNDARGEAMLVEGEGDSSGSGWIVLPWIGISTSFLRLTTNTSRAATEALPHDDAWYAGARLVVIEWIPVAWYRARGEVTLAPGS